jgi:hypothetical protein
MSSKKINQSHGNKAKKAMAAKDLPYWRRIPSALFGWSAEEKNL